MVNSARLEKIAFDHPVYAQSANGHTINTAMENPGKSQEDLASQVEQQFFMNYYYISLLLTPLSRERSASGVSAGEGQPKNP